MPAAILGLIAIHLVLVVVHKHTQYAGPGRTNRNVVGHPVLPVFGAKAGGFFFLVFGIITLISATTSINAMWVYGPYDPSPSRPARGRTGTCSGPTVASASSRAGRSRSSGTSSR
uniref:cytochrome b N-terminal domain-containing protein n=1 Tax=Brachybacterium sp. GPGPB12 TaxID=3023517 RepID=UPI00404A2BE3